MSKPKKIAFSLLDPADHAYTLMADIRREEHLDIAEARIALAWQRGIKADVDGHVLLGRCVKASDLQRELVNWDFVILLNHWVWDDIEFTIEKKKALLDHELCHADRALDKDGQPKVDERMRPVWRVRKHDIEEFQQIVERHGTYKRDLERFAEALLRRREPQLPLMARVERSESARAN